MFERFYVPNWLYLVVCMFERFYVPNWLYPVSVN
jgi:hypothetical protein